MFGFVMADIKELTKEEKQRYNAVYCGICRQIRLRSGQLSRLGLKYDMAFLALLLMSLYEPEESAGNRACGLHPIRPKPWLDNEMIQYAADMNVALAYFQCADDWQDDKSIKAKLKLGLFEKAYPELARRYPRQCKTMEDCIARLGELEKENCANADQVANCFGQLMAELLVYRQDLWEEQLRAMGMALGRFIYLADAALDYRRDKRHGCYNPYLAMGMAENWPSWEEYLVLAMGCCTDAFERLPLVQDKHILDNILYRGVWSRFYKKREEGSDGSV